MVSYATRIQLNKEYKDGATMQKLMDKYGFCLDTIQKYIIRPRKQGIIKGTRLKVTEEMEKQFNELYFKQNKSANSIAKMFSVTDTTVSRYLHVGVQQ